MDAWVSFVIRPGQPRAFAIRTPRIVSRQSFAFANGALVNGFAVTRCAVAFLCDALRAGAEACHASHHALLDRSAFALGTWARGQFAWVFIH